MRLPCLPQRPRFLGLGWHCGRLTTLLSLAVSHRPGAFKAELSKLVIVAKATHSEL